MMSTSLIQGLEIVAMVSAMAIIVSPILCWLLPDRASTLKGDTPTRQTV